MGLGSFELDHDWDPSIAAVLQAQFCHLVIYWGEAPFYAGVVTGVTPSKEGMTLAGRGLDFWLGLDDDGPLIRDREYIAGNNKLDNGDLAYADDLWAFSEGTLWNVVTGSATHTGGSAEDDILAVDQAFECRPGHQYRASLTGSGGAGGPGRLRLRTVYEGRFRPPNLLVNPGFELTGGGRLWSADQTSLTIVDDAGNAHDGTRVLRASAAVRPQLLDNPGFELGQAGWPTALFTGIVNDPTNARTGSWVLKLGPIVRPQLLTNASFESGTASWGAASTLTIIQEPGNAHMGTWVLRASEIPKPQLLPNPGFESGTSGWGTAPFLAILNDAGNAFAGSWVMRAVANGKPQLLTNPYFLNGSVGWSGGTYLQVVNSPGNGFSNSNVLRASPNGKPQLLTNPNFEQGGTGWTLPATGDFAIVTPASGLVFNGTMSMRAGPVQRAQPFGNGDFENGLTYTNPQAGWWYHDTGTKYNGSGAITTDTTSHPELNTPRKWAYISSNPSTSQPFLFTPGERWRYEAKVRAFVDANGQFDGNAHISIHFHIDRGSGPVAGPWVATEKTVAGEGSPGQDWQDLFVEFEVPDDAVWGLPHLFVEDHTLGYWSFDAVRLVKLADNVSEAASNAVAIEPGQEYEFSAVVKSGDELMQGSVALRCEVSGSGLPTLQFTTTAQGSTKRRGSSARDWVRIASTFRADAGYTSARVFVVARDVWGDSFWVDGVQIVKDSNNSDQINANTVAIEPGTQYELAGMVRSGLNITDGEVLFRAKLMGAGKTDIYIHSSRQRDTRNQWVRVSTDFRPPAGYTSAQVSVFSVDVTGDYFWIGEVQLIKDSGNSDAITMTAPIAVTPRQPYKLTAMVRSSAGTTGGSVSVRALVTGAGKKDIVVESRQSATETEWVCLAATVTPPKGYTSALISITSLDIEGDPFYVDDVEFLKDSNNSDSLSHASSVAVTAGQSYELSTYVRSSEGTRNGAIAVRALVTGAGKKDITVESRQGNTEEEWVCTSTTFTPPDGYTHALVSVVSTDVEGDPFYVDNVNLTKADNNKAHLERSSVVAVSPGSRYDLVGHIRSGPAVTRGSLTIGVILSGADLEDVIVDSTQRITDNEWVELVVPVTPGDGYTLARAFVDGIDIDSDSFYLDDLTLTRFTGNVVSITGAPFEVTPERTYRWTEWVRSSTDAEGSIRLSVRFGGQSRPDVIFESSATGKEGDEWKQMEFRFTPPSGYDLATPSILATDVTGFFWVDEGDIRDTDASTRAFDRIIGPGVGAFSLFSMDTATPEGAEKVRVELVAEAGSGTCTITNVSFSRVGSAAVVRDIVHNLLLDPRTNLPTCLLPGRVFGDDTIRFDIHWRNLTARQALLQLCRNGAALPVREFRANPDFTLDFGQAHEICENRPEIALVGGEIHVLEEPVVEQSYESLITDVTVIGADRDTPSGIRRVVTGVATADDLSALDRFGRTARRDRIVSEPTISHIGVADSYAEYQLSQANLPKENVTVGIADWRALGGPDKVTAPGSAPSFRVGDWVQVYKPEAGIEDTTNERVIRGKVVYPAKRRVASRTLSMGSGSFWAELIPPTGDPIRLPNVIWDETTEAELELGELLPEFATDPEGGSISNQFLRYRASVPR